MHLRFTCTLGLYNLPSHCHKERHRLLFIRELAAVDKQGVRWPRQLRNWVLCSPEHQHTDPHLLISTGFFRNIPPTSAWRPVCYQNTRGKTTRPPSCVTVKRKINCPISTWWHSLRNPLQSELIIWFNLVLFRINSMPLWKKLFLKIR